MSKEFSRSRLLVTLAAALALTTALLAGTLLYYGLGSSSDQSAALIGGPFEMTDQDGRRVSDKDFLGKPMLVSFGYTYCPDVCPTQLFEISQALAALGPAAQRLQPVFVTVDPARDTPDALKSYLSNFAQGYRGLTGSADDVAAIARVYRVYYAKVDNPGAPSSYTMDHTSIVYLMDAKGRFFKHFSVKSGDSAKLADQLKQALEAMQG